MLIVIHTVKGFGIANKTEIDVFLELSCFFDDPADVGNLISCSPAFSKTSLNIWKFTVHVLLNPGLEDFKHHFTSMWDDCNCAVVWAFFGIAWKWKLHLTLCDPMDYTVHGILQARLLEWTAFPFSRGSSQPRDGTQVSSIVGGVFSSWATREAQEY